MVSHAHPDAAPPRRSAAGASRDQDGWSPQLVLSLVGLVLVLELLTVSYIMVSTALPRVIGHYHTTQGAWLLSSFLLVGAVTSPVLGKLADIYGKRRLLLFAIAGAALGSVISAVAPNYGLLVIGRGIQGLLVPCMFLSYSLMRDVYPPRTLTLAVSIVTGGMGLITVPSPWLTGWLLDTWGFRSVFWFFAITLALLCVLVAATTGESAVRVRARIDYLGALLLGVGLAAALAGVSLEASWGGWSDDRTIGCIVGGVAVLVLWIALTLRTREPLIDIRYFRRRSVSMTSLAGGFAYGQTAMFNTLLPMLCMTPAALGLHYGFGVDAEGYAIFQAPIGIGGVAGGVLVGVFIRRVNTKLLLIVGAGFLTAAGVLVGVAHGSKGAIIVWAVLQGLGTGMTYAAVPNLVIESVPRELQGAMSSMTQVFQSGISAVFPVLAFTVLNNGTVTVVQGNVFYGNSGMTIGFLLAGGAGVVAALAALAVPRRRTSEVAVPAPAAVAIAQAPA